MEVPRERRGEEAYAAIRQQSDERVLIYSCEQDHDKRADRRGAVTTTTAATRERGGGTPPRRLNINIDPGLHRRLKHEAVEREVTMTEIVTDLLLEALEGDFGSDEAGNGKVRTSGT